MDRRAKARNEKEKASVEVIDDTESSEEEESSEEMLDLSDEELLESQDVSDLIEEPSSGSLLATRSNLPVKAKEEKDVSHQLDLLQKYFREIRKYPLLTKEDEYDLAMRFTETGDPTLAFRLTTSNLRLVVKIAMEYQSAVANLLDLIQEGNIGLMQAVKKFDPFKGIRLSSYAQWWIRAYILKYLVNNARMVKVGTTQAQRKLFFNLRKEKDRLEALGFKPEPALLAERLDVRVEEVNEMEQRLARADVSLDAPLGDDQKSRVSDMMATDEMATDERVIERELHQRIRGFMNDFAKGLKDRERVIWLKRLTSDEPLTLQEIGDLFGVTRERARQIEKDLTRRFREYLQKHMPDLDASDLLP